MSQTITYPIPINTPLMTNGTMSLAWSKYLKNLGDVQGRSATPQNKAPTPGTTKYLGTVTTYPTTAHAGETCSIGTEHYLYNGSTWSKTLTHTLSGSLCSISHDLGSASPASFTLDLPFTAALPFVYENVEYMAGVTEVSIPAGRRIVHLSYTISN